MQDLAFAGEWASENYEPILDQGIHEPCVLLPAILLAQIARPIPWATALEANREEHAREISRFRSCTRDLTDNLIRPGRRCRFAGFHYSIKPALPVRRASLLLAARAGPSEHWSGRRVLTRKQVRLRGIACAVSTSSGAG